MASMSGSESWEWSSAHLSQQLRGHDEFVAMRAGAARAQPTAEWIAVRAAPLAKVALLALGALVDLWPEWWQLDGLDRWCRVAPSPRSLTAGSGAEPGSRGEDLGGTDRATAASWAV